MIVRSFKSKTLRAALACGASALAIALTPAASAQESLDQTYVLRSTSEIADGKQVLSTSSDLVMGRRRMGDQSLLIYDVQNGVMVTERGGQSVVTPLISLRGPELSFAYNYATGELKGDRATASVFNTWIRPIAATSPAAGKDASWAIATDLRALGIMSAGPAPMGFKLKRTHEQVDGKTVVLLEYEIPAFNYRPPGGDSVVHWARGFAVVSTDFSRIYATGMQHRAIVTGADGEMRPISVRSSMHGIESDGDWTMAFTDAPSVRKALQGVEEVSGDQIHATTDFGDATADPFATQLASYLDMAAFAIAEGGANPVPITNGVSSSAQIMLEQLGISSSNASATTLQALGLDPQGPVSPAAVQAIRDYASSGGASLSEGFADQPGVTIYQPVPLDYVPPSGELMFVLGGEPKVLAPVPPGSTPTSSSLIFVLHGSSENSAEAPAASSTNLPATGSVIFHLGGPPMDPTPAPANNGQNLPSNGSVVFQFSKGGGSQQDGATGSGGGSGASLNMGPTPFSLPFVVGPDGKVYLERPAPAPVMPPPSPEEAAAQNARHEEIMRQHKKAMDAIDAMSANLSNAMAKARPIEFGPNPFPVQFVVGVDGTVYIQRTDTGPVMPPLSPAEAEAQRVRNAEIMREHAQMMDMVSKMGIALQNGLHQTSADELDRLVSQMAREGASPEDQRAALLAAVAAAAKALRQDQPSNLVAPRMQGDNMGGFVDMPIWMEPNSPDAADYKQLVAEMQELMDKLRTDLADGKKTDKDKKSGGFGEGDDFFENNAFDYSRMVGTVPTDLSRWAEWLATQNVRELERLASLIGYPNLASALADAENLIRQSQDPGYRKWAMQAPSCNGPAGCGPSYLERWWMKQSTVALGDILNDSRGIFSSGGFSDIGISGLNLAYLLRDHALEDGDIVQIRITQFGRVIYEGQVNLTNAGEVFDLMVGRGVASLEIFAVNEGYSSPNTAQITVDNVVRGEGTQTYSLNTGETATLRIEAGAKAGTPAPGGTP